jgi:hypothetical protein
VAPEMMMLRRDTTALRMTPAWRSLITLPFA